VGIRDVAKHGHPLVRAGVLVATAVLIALLIMTAVSVVVGLVWALIKIVVLVLLVAGIVHIWARSRAANRN
jgi:putative Ca2+/H+ antiporter (TMEM165/GDT1 family)